MEEFLKLINTIAGLNNVSEEDLMTAITKKSLEPYGREAVRKNSKKVAELFIKIDEQLEPGEHIIYVMSLDVEFNITHTYEDILDTSEVGEVSEGGSLLVIIGDDEDRQLHFVVGTEEDANVMLYSGYNGVECDDILTKEVMIKGHNTAIKLLSEKDHDMFFVDMMKSEVFFEVPDATVKPEDQQLDQLEKLMDDSQLWMIVSKDFDFTHGRTDINEQDNG